MKFDNQAILQSSWPQMFWWLLAVVAATWSGYPGVICVTPLGWTMALSAGRRCVLASTSSNPTTRLVEAGLSGAALGLFQGLVFAGVLALATPLGLQTDTFSNAGWTSLLAAVIVGGLGILVGGTLGAVMGAFQMRKL